MSHLVDQPQGAENSDYESDSSALSDVPLDPCELPHTRTVRARPAKKRKRKGDVRKRGRIHGPGELEVRDRVPYSAPPAVRWEITMRVPHKLRSKRLGYVTAPCRLSDFATWRSDLASDVAQSLACEFMRYTPRLQPRRLHPSLSMNKHASALMPQLLFMTINHRLHPLLLRKSHTLTIPRPRLHPHPFHTDLCRLPQHLQRHRRRRNNANTSILRVFQGAH